MTITHQISDELGSIGAHGLHRQEYVDLLFLFNAVAFKTGRTEDTTRLIAIAMCVNTTHYNLRLIS